MTPLTKRRLLYAMAGLLYGATLAAWGLLLGGGGGFTLPWALAASPGGAGLLLWPVLGWLAVGRKSLPSSAVFLCGASAQYFAVIGHAFHEGAGDLNRLRILMNDSSSVLSLTLFAVAYLAGQALLWLTFWRED